MVREVKWTYLYYIFEVVLVVLIIIYGQKAIETLLKKESLIPFGGIILAMTWGAIHNHNLLALLFYPKSGYNYKQLE